MVDGGYTVNGHWQFSSGTDHCHWVVLGAMVPGSDAEATPTGMLHVMLPRRDYEIVEDSWNVMGLARTGSNAWRAAKAADAVYGLCGGNALRLDKPLQRFWRGMHAGLNHAVFTAGPVYDDAAGMLMGFPPKGPAAMTI